VVAVAARPGIFDPKGRAKWDAWDARKGKYQTYSMMGTTSRVSLATCSHQAPCRQLIMLLESR
jgi:hypothetical protein